MLYNKYRPKNLDELAGHHDIKESMGNAIAMGRYPHALLFVGKSGTGKTSLARIMAMAMNCESGGQKPCGSCHSCSDILLKRSPDIIEIDAASNNGVDNIRDLKEKVNFLPVQLRNKVYIIDEFHMMTSQASNALLKTLEEPPPRCYFILCTTELHKVLETIRSRCMEFHFGPLNQSDVAPVITRVVESEGFQIEPQALDVLSLTTDGGLRDAISKVEKCISHLNPAENKTVITLEIAKKYCKSAGKDVVDMLLAALVQNRPDMALVLAEKLEKAGYNLQEIHLQLIDSLHRELTAYYIGKKPLDTGPGLYTNSIKVLADAQQKMSNKLLSRCLFDVSMIECCAFPRTV